MREQASHAPEEASKPPDAPSPLSRSNLLQSRLHELVPGGAHTYARGSDQYPEQMAPVLSRGLAAHVWDVDGNRYIEYGMGLRAVTLGHAYAPVVDAVATEIRNGSNFSRPTELELLAAEDFLDLVPGADMVKFAKNGSDATSAAIRLARAVTGKLRVAVCEQPFFSVADWFIGTTEMSAGVDPASAERTVRFRYNDLASLAAALESGDVACVILEAATAMADPAPGFLTGVRELCDQHGALLVFDEMITGFRWSEHGAQGLYGVNPDLSCWGKAMGNGFPIAALAGKGEFMELGGLRTDADRVFLLSTTQGPESVGLAAFRAVVRAYAENQPIERMERAGTTLAAGMNRSAAHAGIAEHFQVVGRPSCLVFITRGPDGQPSQEFRTLFLQEMIPRGFLGQSLVLSAAHTDTDLAETIAAATEALEIYAQAIESGGVEGFLRGRPVAPALRRKAAPRRLS